MANSFEPLAGFAGTAGAESSAPWFAALSQGSGFQPDARFPHSRQGVEAIYERFPVDLSAREWALLISKFNSQPLETV